MHDDWLNKSAADCIKEIVSCLDNHNGNPSAPFVLIVGAGFSFDVVPLTLQMVQYDLCWWLFCRGKLGDPKAYGRQLSPVPGASGAFDAYSRSTWEQVARETGADLKFDTSGRPVAEGDNISRAFQAMMNDRAVSGLQSRALRREYLRDVTGRNGRKCTRGHVLLADIMEAQDTWITKEDLPRAPFCRMILTTNFDRQLQDALADADVRYNVEVLEDDGSPTIQLGYVHGTEGKHVLINTVREMDQTKGMDAMISPWLEKRGVIVIGYGGWDDVLMRALLRCPGFDHKLYWCGRADPASVAASLPPNVRKLLAEGTSTYYVQIKDADSFMADVHKALGLGGNVSREVLLRRILRKIYRSGERPPDGIEKELLGMGPVGAGPDIGGRPKFHHELDKALQLAKNPSCDAAVDRLSRIFERHADTVREKALALYNRGVCQGLCGRDRDAVADYNRVIAEPQSPGNLQARARVNRGLAYKREGRMSDALLDYTAAIESADSDSEPKSKALINRAGIYRAQGDEIKAIEDFRAILTVVGANFRERATALNELQLWDDMIVDCTVVIDADDSATEDRIVARINRGKARAHNDQWEEAVNDLTEALQIQGTSPENRARALMNRSWAHKVLRHETKQRADLSAVIAMTDAPEGNRAEAYLHRGRWFGARSEHDSAIADFRRATEVPGAPAAVAAEARFLAGFEAGKKEDWERALQDLDAYLTHAEAAPSYRANALILRAIARQRVAAPLSAIDAYGEVVEQRDAPSEARVDAHFLRGVALEAAKRFADAILDFDAVLSHAGIDSKWRTEALVMRGRCQLFEGHADLARADGSAALQGQQMSAANRAAALWVLAMAHEEGDKDTSVEWLQEALALPGLSSEDQAKARGSLAAIWIDSGRVDDAIMELTAVLVTADTPPDHQSLARITRSLAYRKKGTIAESRADDDAAVLVPEISKGAMGHALSSRGNHRGMDGNIDGAIEDLTEALSIPSLSDRIRVQTLERRALAFVLKENADAAIADCTAGMELVGGNSRKYSGLWLNRAQARGMKADWAGQIEDLNSIIDAAGMDSNSKAMALVNRGGARAERGETDAASADWQAVLSMPDATPDPILKARENLARLAGMQADLAAATARWAQLGSSAEVPVTERIQALIDLAGACSRIRHFEQAVTLWTALLAEDDLSPEQVRNFLGARGYAYLMLQKREEAARDLKRLAELPAPADATSAGSESSDVPQQPDFP